MPQHSLDDVRGGKPDESAEALRRVMAGEPGPLRDFTLLNAAPALVAGGFASDIRAGLALAAETIDGGAALGKLEALIKVSNEVA